MTHPTSTTPTIDTPPIVAPTAAALEPPGPTTCPACGEPFVKGQWLTIASWFVPPGTPRDEDIVHDRARCRNARRPKR